MDNKQNKKNLITLSIIIILVITIPIVIYLIRQQTVLKSRATPEDQIQFFTNANPPQPLSGIPPVTNNQNIKVKLNYIVPTSSSPTPTTSVTGCTILPPGNDSIGYTETKTYSVDIACSGEASGSGSCGWALTPLGSSSALVSFFYRNSIEFKPSILDIINAGSVSNGTYTLRFTKSNTTCSKIITITGKP